MLISLKNVYNHPIFRGLIAGILAFFIDALLIYYGTGIYTYGFVSFWAVVEWLIDWYFEYMLGFSIGVGATVTLLTYMKRINETLRGIRVDDTNAKRLSFLGIFASTVGIFSSVFSSIFFACCAPFMLSLISVLGGTIISLIVYSRKIFLIGLILQGVGILYGAWAFKRLKNTVCKCQSSHD